MIEDQIKYYLQHHLKIDIIISPANWVRVFLKLDDEVISTCEDKLPI